MVLLCASVVLLPAPSAEAQDSHWGVTGSFVPKWQALPELWKVLYDVDDTDTVAVRVMGDYRQVLSDREDLGRQFRVAVGAVIGFGGR